MRTAIIRDGVVVNIVEGVASPEAHPGATLVDATDLAVGKGDTHDGVAFTRAKKNKLSREQFLSRWQGTELADAEVASIPVAGDNPATAGKRAAVAQFLRWMEGVVDLSHGRVAGAKSALMFLNVLTAQRANEIFDPR